MPRSIHSDHEVVVYHAVIRAKQIAFVAIGSPILKAIEQTLRNHKSEAEYLSTGFRG
jgi:hypothetical protein